MTVKVTILDNGLRIATDYMNTVETISVGAWVAVGARHEVPELNGISHLLEHMAFKGTRRRSARAIVEEIEAVGGHLNAYTSRDNTAYFAKILKDDLGLAVDIIADILQNSTMDEDELARERAVIVQEINQSHDTPDDVVFDWFQEAAFPNQAMGRPVLGSAQLVEGVERTTLIDYMRKQYSAERMILAAAGNVDHDTFVELAANAFTSLPKELSGPAEPLAYTGGEHREHRDLEQVHVVLGFEGISYDDPDYYPLAIYSTLLGGGMSSRLFQEVREKRGLAYSVYSFASSYEDGGLFGVYAGTGAKDIAELMPVVCEETLRLCDGATEDELLRTRAQLKSSTLMALESTFSRCEQMARQLQIYGRTIPVPEVIDKIDQVDLAAVIRIAERIIESKPTLAAIGPVDELESYDQVADRMTS